MRCSQPLAAVLPRFTLSRHVHCKPRSLSPAVADLVLVRSMTRVSCIGFAALSLVSVTGCFHYSARRILTPPATITRIDVLGSGEQRLKRIDSIDDIGRIRSFVADHRSGWTQPWAGVPVPQIRVYFYDGERYVGRFGAGSRFFESDLAGDLFCSVDAPDSDVHTFLTLIGMPDFRFQ